MPFRKPVTKNYLKKGCLNYQRNKKFIYFRFLCHSLNKKILIKQIQKNTKISSSLNFHFRHRIRSAVLKNELKQDLGLTSGFERSAQILSQKVRKIQELISSSTAGL